MGAEEHLDRLYWIRKNGMPAAESCCWRARTLEPHWSWPHSPAGWPWDEVLHLTVCVVFTGLQQSTSPRLDLRVLLTGTERAFLPGCVGAQRAAPPPQTKGLCTEPQWRKLRSPAARQAPGAAPSSRRAFGGKTLESCLNTLRMKFFLQYSLLLGILVLLVSSLTQFNLFSVCGSYVAGNRYDPCYLEYLRERHTLN